MRKICIVTATRAEYGLLYWLIKGVHEDPELELQLLVTGAHLSHEFGLTWKQIEQDGFPILRKIEMLMSSDTAVGVSKANALAMISFAEVFEELKPDLVIVLGDRSETLSVAFTALIAAIPIAHIHGGELTEGAYDDSIRHAITKMSHLHFTATEEYRQRVIQLGEQPEYVFNVGAMGLDNIQRLTLLSKEDFEAAIGRKLLKKNLLVTFHPVTLEKKSSETQVNELLSALDTCRDTLLIFTLPNADKAGRIIIERINNYVSNNPEKAIAFQSLGQLRYLSAIQYMDAVVGNSSSGIIEVPFFNVPTVNIGDRQKGRLMGGTIINCLPFKQEITQALNNAFAFDRNHKESHPYGNGDAADKILQHIKACKEIMLKKKFYNILTSDKDQ